MWQECIPTTRHSKLPTGVKERAGLADLGGKFESADSLQAAMADLMLHTVRGPTSLA